MIEADFSAPVLPDLPGIDPYQVEENLPLAVRRAIRLNRIAAYEGTCWESLIPGERICLEFDA